MAWDQKHKEWAAMMEHLDRHVGEIMETLDEHDLSKNTIVFFASDNGYAHWGYFNRERWENDPIFDNKGPWKGGKFLPLDGGVRVPFFVKWEDKIKPGTTRALVSLIDFLATACDLAGVAQTPTDGISLLPLMTGKSFPESSHHEYLYWENGSFGPHAQAARFRNWFAFREHPDKPMQIWDLSSDVSCNEDLSATNIQVVEEALRIFQESHEPSEWYVNPGDTEELIENKKKKAVQEGSMQEPVRANSRYPEEL
jgi:arylsulfatase A-like enzyme